MKLTNPHLGLGDDTTQVYAKLDPKVFNYFFRGLFAGDRGTRSTLIALFFQKLYDECTRIGLKPTWDPDNESHVSTLLANLNFSPLTIPGLLTRFPDGFTVDSSGGVIERKPRSSRGRRADPPSVEYPTQPIGEKYVDGGADRPGHKA